MQVTVLRRVQYHSVKCNFFTFISYLILYIQVCGNLTPSFPQITFKFTFGKNYLDTTMDVTGLIIQVMKQNTKNQITYSCLCLLSNYK